MSALEGAALWALLVVPAVVGAVLCLGARRLEPVAAIISVSTASLVALLGIAVAVTRPVVSQPFMADTAFEVAVDGLSAAVVPAVAVVTLLVLTFSATHVVSSTARFHGLMLLFLAAVMVTATATTLPTLLLAWEVMGATSYALIGFHWQEGHRVDAGAVAFLTTRTADLGVYIAAGAALAGGAGLALADLSQATAGWRHAIAAGLLIAALGKAAQLPFTFWLSRAMDGPSPVSALLHSAAMVAMGGYLLLRVEPLLAATDWAASAAAWAGALTALLLGAVAVAQHDLKQLLAASTSAQLGFVVLGAGVGAVAGGTAHLVAHASTKALLFLAAGAWLAALGSKQLPALRGAARTWPVVGVAAGIGALALAGVAPLSLWATKDEVLAAAHETSPFLYVVGLAAAALSAAYAAKILVVLWGRRTAEAEAGYDAEEPGTRRIGLLEQAPLVVLAAGALVLALLALPPIGHSFRAALGDTASPTAGPFELVGSALLALVVLAAVLRWRLPEPAWAAAWLGLEQAVDVAVVRPTVWLSEVLARFDDDVLDRAVTRGARLGIAASRRLAVIDDRRIDGAVELAASTARHLGEVARRPQTGLLHHYYVQTAAVLAAGVVLLVVLG